ncbi:hypothetical protein ACPPVW_15085 [Leifsonia sp. McL0607]
MTEAIRRAIAVYKYIEDQVDEGRTVQTVDKATKDVKELVLI